MAMLEEEDGIVQHHLLYQPQAAKLPTMVLFDTPPPTLLLQPTTSIGIIGNDVGGGGKCFACGWLEGNV